MPRHNGSSGSWSQPGRKAGNKRRKPSRRKSKAGAKKGG